MTRRLEGGSGVRVSGGGARSSLAARALGEGSRGCDGGLNWGWDGSLACGPRKEGGAEADSGGGAGVRVGDDSR
jgi:hypothetical protein